MAFNVQNLNNSSSGAADAPRIWTYKTTVDALAAVVTSAYFNTMKNAFKVSDLIWVVASDDESWAKVSAVTPNVTTTTTI